MLIIRMNLPDQYNTIYEEVKSLFPEDKDNPKFQYVNKYWIFPNHLDIVINSCFTFVDKYYPNASKDVVFLSALLHDTGLVYKRDSDDPGGHEERSIEYAQIVLKKYGYSEDVTKQVIHCIKSTEPENLPTTDEAKIVRTADAYSHFVSIHFFAKSNFTEKWEKFFNWFSKKLESTFNKLEIEEVKEEIRPIFNHYQKAIEIYNTAQ